MLCALMNCGFGNGAIKTVFMQEPQRYVAVGLNLSIMALCDLCTLNSAMLCALMSCEFV